MKLQSAIIHRVILFLVSACVLAFALGAQATGAGSAEGRRLALVVGNSSYAANPLRNPVNDAQDIAAALKQAGFQVRLVKDADNLAFEQAVRSFAADLKGAAAGLFYYAGHGVQIEGTNYLIPVQPRMDDPLTVKTRAMPVDTVVGLMEQSGVPTVLLFLDSCRDNPFPGASRSGSRGLSVVPTPRTRNSLIAYATSPGDTAADGEGRNGIFSGALLAQLRNPGLELSAMMKAVKADVAKQTRDKQNPRVDDGMKDDFYFVDPQALAREALARADAAARDLATLEKAIADGKILLNSSKSASEKKKLDLEQQRQEALATAKRVEADNLAREAQRSAELAEAARNNSNTKKAADDLARQELDALARQVALKQKEYADLVRVSRNALDMKDQIQELEASLNQTSDTYIALLEKIKAGIASRFALQLEQVKKASPGPVETDQEFEARIAGEIKALKKQESTETDAAIRSTLAERDKATAALKDELKNLRANLARETWTMQGADLKLVMGAWQRNTKQWPFSLDSTDPLVPWHYDGVIDWSRLDAAKLKQAWADMDMALQSGGLQAELKWQISTEKGWERVRRSLRLFNIANNATLWNIDAHESMGPVLDLVPRDLDWFMLPMTAADRNLAPTCTLGGQSITLSNKGAPRRIYLPKGKQQIEIKVPNGSYTFSMPVRRTDPIGNTLMYLSDGWAGAMNQSGALAYLSRGSKNGELLVALANLPEGRVDQIPIQAGSGARTAALSEDSRFLLLRDVDKGGLSLWEPAKGKKLWEKLPALNLSGEYAVAAIMTRDAKGALVAWSSNRISLVDLANGNELASFKASKRNYGVLDRGIMAQLGGSDQAWVLVDDGPDLRVLVVDFSRPKTAPVELVITKEQNGSIVDFVMASPDKGYMILDTTINTELQKVRTVRSVPDGKVVSTLPAGFQAAFFSTPTPGSIFGWLGGRLVQVDLAGGATLRDWGDLPPQAGRVIEAKNLVMGKAGSGILVWASGPDQ